MVMFRSDKGSQSNKGRSPCLIGQIRARALPSQIKANLSQIRAAQVWPRLRYGLVEYEDAKKAQRDNGQ